MDANYIYDIFETTRENHAPDLNIGLAMLQTEQPLPDGMTEKETREFLGQHYEALVEAYRTRDRETMAAAVAKCEEEDRLLKEQAQRAHADLP